MESIDIDQAVYLKSALLRWASAMEKAAPELNERDAQLGDGDLGVTLEKCAKNVIAALDKETSSPHEIFKNVSQACADASGSSFGTLLTSGFFATAKWLQEGKDLDRNSLSELLNHIVQKLSKRGGASLGDKTMLDSLHAISIAIENCGAQEDLSEVALQGALKAIEDFRNQPNKIGRARMFAEKTIGLDDPGMVAVLRMVESI